VGGGEGERGPGGALVDQEQRGGLLRNILVLKKNLAWISFSTFSQTLKDKGEGVVATTHVD
jgi:hypothetical protein